MKKSLLLASMAAMTLSAAAQGVDPATYAVKEGYQLTNDWLMSRGNGENGVALSDWLAMEGRFANAGKATMAVMEGDYIYITCSQEFVPGIDAETGASIMVLEDNGHVVVVDAKTGKFVKDLPLTYNGERFYGLICANWIGKDNAGHVCIGSYVSNCYDSTTGASKPMNLYLLNTETGELTLVNAFEFDELEGPSAGGRIDYYDIAGDVLEGPAAFMAIPNENNKVYIWVKDEGSDWDVPSEGYNVIEARETYPAMQGAWNYSPMGAFVYDDDFNIENLYYWVDGHATKPSLYDLTGELSSSFMQYAGDFDEGGTWEGFFPETQPNGMRQFDINGDAFLAYAVQFPDDNNMGGQMAIAKLGPNLTLDDAVPMWTAPAAKLGIKKGEGRFSHSFSVSEPITDDAGKIGRRIMLYKDFNGLGVYTLAQAGFKGVNDIVAGDNSNAPAEYFNLNGVRVQGELAPGLYIKRQGTEASKVVIR